ncbi:MAG: PEP-CTERM sorting domain-containing protein [Pirellulales bacterium]
MTIKWFRINRFVWAMNFTFGLVTTIPGLANGALVNASVSAGAEGGPDFEEDPPPHTENISVDTEEPGFTGVVRLDASPSQAEPEATASSIAQARSQRVYTDDNGIPTPIGWTLHAFADASATDSHDDAFAGSGAGTAQVYVKANYNALYGIPREYNANDVCFIRIQLDGQLSVEHDNAPSSGGSANVIAYARVSHPNSPTDYDEYRRELLGVSDTGHVDNELRLTLRNQSDTSEIPLLSRFFRSDEGVELELGLYVRAQVGGTGYSRAGYQNTMHIASFDFIDEHGNFIPGITVTDDLGVRYPVNGILVPEPSTLLLVILLAVIAVLGSPFWRRRNPTFAA